MAVGHRHDMGNEEVARVLDEIGDLLDILGESGFRTQAYHKAAMNIRSMSRSIEEVYEADELQKIPGVGAHLAERIATLLKTGSLPYLEELKKKVPPSLIGLMAVPGLGAKKAKKLFDELDITSVEELKRALDKHEVASLTGMGEKTEENILRGIAQIEQLSARILLVQALPVAEEILRDLKEQPYVEKADAAGSLRRMKETVGDIDLLCSSREPERVMECFTTLPHVAYVIAGGEKRSSVVVTSGLQVDLRVVAPEEFGAALQYFTGSKSHNIHLREIAKKRGLKINEYGVFRVSDGKRVAGATEEEVYGYLGMETPPPVLREDRGEIEAAVEDRLPRLIELSDIRGDLHTHTNATDGINKLDEMIEAAREIDYDYICITDHAERLKVAGGLTEKELLEQLEAIDRLNEVPAGFTILKGIELNIDNEGAVDYPNDILARMDVVVGSIHSGFSQTESQLTNRMVAAMKNPHIDVIAHPTGRILGKRPPYRLDLSEVFRAAAGTGTILECNSLPDRLDLRDEHLMEAKFTYGCKFVVSTDAHNVEHLKYMSYGVSTAQRGWLEPADVVNAHSVRKMLDMLK